jgi:flagellar basal body P-ring formation protein FlgA
MLFYTIANKSRAKNINFMFFRCLEIFLPINPANKEIQFPPRKWFVPLLLFLCLPAHSEDLADRLKQHMESLLLQHSRDQGWPRFRYAVEPWLPASYTHLEKCKQDLYFYRSQPDRPPLRRVSVQIQCKQPAWSIRARATVHAWIPVLLSKTTLRRGQVLGADTVYLKEIEVSGLYDGFFTHYDQVAHHRVAKRIRAGKVITLSALQQQTTISRGDEVIIEAKDAILWVSTKGIALEGGVMGERIQVQNLTSKKEIQATVTGKGRVQTLF